MVVIDEPPWMQIERLERVAEELPNEEEQVNAVRHAGCAILDSGASTGVTSLPAADELQLQRLNAHEPGMPIVSPSDRRFRLGNGSAQASANKMTQPITAGILQGQEVDFHLIDAEGNNTLPSYPINELRKNKMVVDYEANRVMFKDKPDVWHDLPTTDPGDPRALMWTPLTQEAVDRYAPQTYHVE